MKKLSIGLLAAVVVALAAAPADAAKKKSSSKKGKAKAEVSKVDPSHPMMISCFLTGITGTKSPGPGCGR
jgi:hypothetical protein